MTTHHLIATIENDPDDSAQLALANQFAFHMNKANRNDNAFHIITNCTPSKLTPVLNAIHTATGITPDVITVKPATTNTNQDASKYFQQQVAERKEHIKQAVNALSSTDHLCFEFDTSPNGRMQNYLTTLNTMVTSNNHSSHYQIRLDETTHWQAINGFWHRSVKLQRHQRTVDERALIKIPCNDNISEDDVMLITSHQTPFLCDLVESKLNELKILSQELPTNKIQEIVKQDDAISSKKATCDINIDIAKQTKEIIINSSSTTLSTHNTATEENDTHVNAKNLIKISQKIRINMRNNKEQAKKKKTLSKAIRANQTQINKLRVKLEQLDSEPSENVKTQTQITKLEAQNQSKQSDIDTLDEKLTQITSESHDFNLQLQQITRHQDFDTIKTQAINQLDVEITKNAHNLNSLYQEHDNVKKTASELLQSIKKQNDQLEKHFQNIDTVFREIQNQLLQNPQLQSDLLKDVEAFKTLWDNHFRLQPQSRYSFEPPNYHMFQGILDQNTQLSETISSGETRNQFEAHRAQIRNFYESHSALHNWIALISSYTSLIGIRSMLYNRLSQPQAENSSLLSIQTISPQLMLIRNQLISTEQQYRDYKQQNRAHIKFNEIHSLQSLQKTETWNEWAHQNKVPLILLGLGLACVATTVTLATIGAPIIATMAAVPFIHAACAAVAHTFGISQIVAQASVLSGASGLIFPTLTGLLYKFQNSLTQFFKNRQPQPSIAKPSNNNNENDYKVSNPTYTAITKAELTKCTPKEKAHLFFNEYTHIIRTQANPLTNSPLLNHLAQDQSIFQYPNRNLALIRNSQNQNNQLQKAIKDKEFTDECVRLPLLIDTVLHATHANNNNLTNAIFNSNDRLFEILLYTRAIIADPKASFQEKKRAQGLLNHVRFKQKLETCDSTVINQLLTINTGPDTSEAESGLTTQFNSFRGDIVSNKAFTAKIQAGGNDLTQINTEFWNALFEIKKPDSLTTTQITFIETIVNELNAPSKRDDYTTQLIDTIEVLTNRIDPSEKTASLHHLLTTIKDSIATRSQSKPSLSDSIYKSISGWLWSQETGNKHDEKIKSGQPRHDPDQKIPTK